MTPVTSIGMNIPSDITSLIGGPGPHFTPDDLRKAIANDFGIGQEQKTNLFAILNSPNMAEQLLAGAGGAAVGFALAKYKEMSGTAQTLMSLAGFGLGNIIMNSLTQPGKFTQWNPRTAKNKVLL